MAEDINTNTGSTQLPECESVGKDACDTCLCLGREILVALLQGKGYDVRDAAVRAENDDVLRAGITRPNISMLPCEWRQADAARLAAQVAENYPVKEVKDDYAES